ncbi:aminoglycoside phosphotransferase family protein [Streptomyces sp. NPDC020742]|uniref:aminoglycoside phosphotransferase family protein n=1 Tax=Streptomyces sp. NPDC020742 TaxID=3154897 RepID=UPI0033F50C65
MPGRTMHADEIPVDVPLVRRLLGARFPQWAPLPLTPVDSVGTSNVMYRLGADKVVRLPRMAGAAEDVAKEHRWLPRLAPSLPAAVPEPLGEGAPADGYPFPWSVYGWLAGGHPVIGRLAEPVLLAGDLGEFVAALHRIDPTDGPPSYRSETLAARDGITRAALGELRGTIDGDAATAVWDEALRAPGRSGPPVWIHADLQPGNLLLTEGRLSAVIDFGCLGVGDPAVDLIVAWYVLPERARQTFRAAVEADDAMWTRGRGWALSVALMELRYYRDTNPAMAATARHVIQELLASR